MFAKLNFVTVYLFMFALTLACAVTLPPLTSQALETSQTKMTMASSLEEVVK
ncbi:MAG: hypothetical protein KUG61_02135 [Parvibaculaceae bacterium]|nr:hypothetical protein [Parvibaculaceae bacterium]